MGASCSVFQMQLTKTAVERIDIRTETDQASGHNIISQSSRADKSDGDLFDPNKFGTIPEIQLEQQSMQVKNDMRVSDVGISNTLDPSVNIEQTTKRIELTRRNSKIESETIAKQKLLRRIHSKEGCSTGDQVTEPELVNLLMSTVDTGEIVDPSLDVTALEDRLNRERRKSQCDYQKRLSIKRESIKKKVSLTADESTDQGSKPLAQVST